MDIPNLPPSKVCTMRKFWIFPLSTAAMVMVFMNMTAPAAMVKLKKNLHLMNSRHRILFGSVIKNIKALKLRSRNE